MAPPTDQLEAPLSRSDAMIGPAELRNHFDGRWVGGFRVVAAVHGPDGPRYRVVRCSDDTPLPVNFVASDIRPVTDGA